MSFVTYVICKTPAKLRLSFEIHKKSASIFSCTSKTEKLRPQVKVTIKF